MLSLKQKFQTRTTDELIRNIKTYELKKQLKKERQGPKKEKNLTLETAKSNSSNNDSLYY